MIRRLVTLLGIVSLTYFTACSGGDDKAPPPIPPQAKNKQPDFNDLMLQAQRMKDSCTNDLTPLFLILATQSRNPSGGHNQAIQMLPLLMQQQNQDQCKNDLMNFLMALNTIQIPGYGPYANHPMGKEYAKQQLIAVMNRIYGRITTEFQSRGITLTLEQQMALQQDLLQLAQIYAMNSVNTLGPYAAPLRQAAGLG